MPWYHLVTVTYLDITFQHFMSTRGRVSLWYQIQDNSSKMGQTD